MTTMAYSELRIATYNIHGAGGRWRQRSTQRIAGVVAELDADIIALQEVPLNGASNAPGVLDDLQHATGMEAVAGPTLQTERGDYGNAVLSRLPIRAARTLDLSFTRREPRGALDADIEYADGVLRVVATHLGLSAIERSAQVRTLLAAFDSSALPVILLGDINEWFVHGRALRALVGHFRRAPAPRTFPARWPILSLDRIWVHPGEWLIDVQVHRSALARVASDHLPLIARIRATGNGTRPLEVAGVAAPTGLQDSATRTGEDPTGDIRSLPR
ncbi:endonuclease/exonuclease/phosphatase family protein [Mycetohabitans sp. B2]|nr:endonuclease/exonuclease/phosphatase family protein [Mycetohabitans sp. B2]